MEEHHARDIVRNDTQPVAPVYITGTSGLHEASSDGSFSHHVTPFGIPSRRARHEDIG